jgi:hypothetical protein
MHSVFYGKSGVTEEEEEEATTRSLVARGAKRAHNDPFLFLPHDDGEEQGRQR